MQDFRVETFLTVCETMNYTEAANRLHITQPAVSQQIRFLEESYGVKLFSYANRKLTLTRQGSMLRDGCVSMRNDEDILRRKLAESKGELMLLRLGLTMTVGDFMIADSLARLMAAHPEMRLEVHVDDTGSLLSMLDAGGIDCAIIEGYFDRTLYSWRLVRHEPFIGICSPDHPLPHLGDLRFDELLHEGLIVREEGSVTRAVLEHALAAENLNVCDFAKVTEANSLELICQLVARGCGISFLYQVAAAEQIAMGTLHQIPLVAGDLGHDIVAVWRRDTMFHERYEDLFSELVE